MIRIPVTGGPRIQETDLWVQGQPSLQTELQDSQDSTEKQQQKQ